MAAASRLVPAEDIRICFEVIQDRNKIAHEGLELPDGTKQRIRRFLSVVALFLDGARFKFPTAFPGNALVSSEQWEEFYRRRLA